VAESADTPSPSCVISGSCYWVLDSYNRSGLHHLNARGVSVTAIRVRVLTRAVSVVDVLTLRVSFHQDSKLTYQRSRGPRQAGPASRSSRLRYKFLKPARLLSVLLVAVTFLSPQGSGNGCRRSSWSLWDVMLGDGRSKFLLRLRVTGTLVCTSGRM
jgi:hypothetical protein